MTTSRIARYTEAVKQELYDHEINFSARRRASSGRWSSAWSCTTARASSQKDIASALGVSAATVSRLLKRAFDEGSCASSSTCPAREALETALVQRFGLRDAVVVAAGGRGDIKEELGAAAAAYFEKIARNGMRVGLSCGFTLYQTIRALRERRLARSRALPAVRREHARSSSTSSRTRWSGMMAAKYRPHVRAYALPVQHLLSLREIERERRRLLRDPEIRRDLRGRAGRRHRAGGHRPHRREHAGVLLAGGVLRGQRQAAAPARRRRRDQLPALRRRGPHRRPPGAARAHAARALGGRRAAAGAVAARRPLRDGGGRRAAEGGGGARRAARALHERARHRRGRARRRSCGSADAGSARAGRTASSKAPIRRNFS